MARPVSFTKPKKPRRAADTSFDFGFNALPKAAKKAFNRRQGKAGHKAGGGS